MHLWQRLKSGLRNDDTIAPIAFLMVLPFVLFFAVTLGGYTLLPVDNLFQWEPFRSGAAALGVGRPQNELLSDLILENYVWKRFILDSGNTRRFTHSACFTMCCRCGWPMVGLRP